MQPSACSGGRRHRSPIRCNLTLAVYLPLRSSRSSSTDDDAAIADPHEPPCPSSFDPWSCCRHGRRPDREHVRHARRRRRRPPSRHPGPRLLGRQPLAARRPAAPGTRRRPRRCSPSPERPRPRSAAGRTAKWAHRRTGRSGKWNVPCSPCSPCPRAWSRRRTDSYRPRPSPCSFRLTLTARRSALWRPSSRAVRCALSLSALTPSKTSATTRPTRSRWSPPPCWRSRGCVCDHAALAVRRRRPRDQAHHRQRASSAARCAWSNSPVDA